MTISTAPTQAAVDESRATAQPAARVALASDRRPSSGRALRRIALAAGAEITGSAGLGDGRSFVEHAQAFRDAVAQAVLLDLGDPRQVGEMATLIEALRLGCASQAPPPRILAIGDERAASAVHRAAHPFEVAALDATAAIPALRAVGGISEPHRREELLEDAARALAGSSRGDALVVDVSERTTALVLARTSGRIDAAHFVPLGMGAAADRVLAHAGVDQIRRWLPWLVEAPAVVERVFNRSRWPGARPASAIALALEMALAREAIALALREAGDVGFDVGAMRAAPSVLVTGTAASLPRAAQTLLVALDGLEPSAAATVYREPDEGRAERLAMVVPVSARRRARLRLISAAGRREERIEPGTFVVVPLSGDVEVTGAGVRAQRVAGALGVVIDARGRPLEVPQRDGDRIPALLRWHDAVGAMAAEAPAP